MLVVYRRHRKGRPGLEAKQPREYWRCACPIWVQGRLLDNEYFRESPSVSMREAAPDLVRQWEIAGGRTEAVRMRVSSAIDLYLRDCEARWLRESSLRKIRHLLRPNPTKEPNKARARSITLVEFAGQRGLDFIDQLTPELMMEFRAGWVDGKRPTRAALTSSYECL